MLSFQGFRLWLTWYYCTTHRFSNRFCVESGRHYNRESIRPPLPSPLNNPLPWRKTCARNCCVSAVMAFSSQGKQRQILSLIMRPKLPEVVVVLERLSDELHGRITL
jgi:hypothetical protein